MIPEGYADALTGAGGPLYKYYRRDHLGTVREVWQAAYSVYIPSRNITQNYTATTLQRTQYYPSGLPWAANTGDNPGLQNKKYNAKEFIEMHGYDISDYGWRGLENATMRFNNVDPLAEKYPGISPYVYCNNNPINAIDPDGQDIVYINTTGSEVYRIQSNKVYSTYIQGTRNASADPSKSTIGWKQVSMPNIIQERTQSGEDVSGAAYQANDYQIAARTGYFNQAKNAGILKLYTDGGNEISQDAVKSIPDLDPTLVKAITIQESHAGATGITDLMTSNTKADWSSFKTKYSLEVGVSPNVSNSLYSGIRILGTKGFKGGITYDTKTGLSTYTFQGWDNATKSYNGKGVKNYQKYIQTMMDNSKKPTPADY